MQNSVIYMDHNATTPTDHRVIDAMLPFFSECFGNAASRTHLYGHNAERAVLTARNQVAQILNADSKEIIWTSGATESNNLALLGIVKSLLPKPCHVVTQSTEHPSILDTCDELERLGVVVERLPVDSAGRVTGDQVRAALRPETVLVSIMAANNEIGTIQPIGEIGRICRDMGVMFHTDATQAVGKLKIDVQADCIDLLSLSAHKFYGPKGVGALYIRNRTPRIRLHPILFGGGHERGFRSGTINVAGVVGLGRACEIAQIQMEEEAGRLQTLRDRLEREIEQGIDGVYFNARSPNRMPHVANIGFRNVEAEALLMNLSGVAASTGSACSSMKMEASHVLRAIGLTEQEAFGSIRLSMGRGNTEAEVDVVVQQLTVTVRKLRALNPLA